MHTSLEAADFVFALVVLAGTIVAEHVFKVALVGLVTLALVALTLSALLIAY
jgi:hypothetical protein